ncbi:MAG: phage antirepressor KilAC domain-containing protein [Cyclobacteriaceae bacterium]|jgi:phage antirepressor YoqD-like protein
MSSEKANIDPNPNWPKPWVSIQTAAKLISHYNVGRTNLYKFLTEEGMIYQHVPKQELLEKGYFKVEYAVHRDGTGGYVESPVLLVSQAGFTMIKRLLAEKHPKGYPTKKREQTQPGWQWED